VAALESTTEVPVSRELALKLAQATVDQVEDYSWEDRWGASWKGYLLKLDSKKSALGALGGLIWRKRWFLLRENILLYYHHEMVDIWAKDVPPSGFIDLREAIVRLSNHLNSFEIVNPERTWQLQAKSREELLEVMGVIDRVQQHFRNVPLILPSSPLHGKDLFKAGYLERRTNFGLKWTRNWVVLRGGTMFWFRDEQSPAALGSMPLHHSEINEYKSTQFPFAFEVKSHRGHSEVFNTDNDMTLFEWVNALIQQRVFIDETMANIILS
jgi:hypothetical protein